MMFAMNPFEQPPTGTPVSLDPPGAAGHGGHDGPRRGRMAIAALAAAGLVGGGIVVAGQFASADRPTFDASAAVDEPVDEPTDDDAPPSDGESAPDPDGEPGTPSIEGEIVIDDGDGDPFVLDLGELGGLGECIGPILGGGLSFDFDAEWDGEWDGGEGDGERRPPLPFDDEFQQRMEEFLDGLPWDELGDLDHDLHDDGVRIFGSGGSTITVVGPDGIEVIDLGDGDATVTIEQRDGELSVETEGDATVNELPDLGELLPELGELDPGELDPGELDSGEWRDHMPFDLDELESCLDELDRTGPEGDGS